MPAGYRKQKSDSRRYSQDRSLRYSKSDTAACGIYNTCPSVCSPREWYLAIGPVLARGDSDALGNPDV